MPVDPEVDLMVMPSGRWKKSQFKNVPRIKIKERLQMTLKDPSGSEPKARRRWCQEKDSLGPKSREPTVNRSVCEDGSIDEPEQNGSVELKNSSQVAKLLGTMISLKITSVS